MRPTDITLSRRGLMAGMAGTAAAGLTGGSWSGAALAAAPQIGPAAPTHYRFKLGEFEVTTISDGAVQVEGPHPIFGENVSAAEVQALAAQNFLPPDKMVIGFAPVVVNTGKELVLFDTGNGAARRPDAGRLASLLGHRRVPAGADRHRGAEPFPPRSRRRPDRERPAAAAERALRHRGGRIRLLEPEGAALRPDRARRHPGPGERRAARREDDVHQGGRRGRARHRGARRVRPYARAHGVPHRERRQAAGRDGGYREPLRGWRCSARTGTSASTWTRSRPPHRAGASST